ncbi:MAG: hypothetical protein R3E58_17440 [Phycisphaerae bacterium]
MIRRRSLYNLGSGLGAQLSLVLMLFAVGCLESAIDPSKTVQFDVSGMGLEGVGAPVYATVARTTDSFQGGASAIDVYVPTGVTSPTPLLVLLQGARVHKSYYTQFCTRLAAHGFVVAAANHDSLLGYFTSTGSVQEVLDALAVKSVTQGDPLYGIPDLDRIGLVGHSFGGATALTYVQGDCNFPFCAAPFEASAAIRAVATYASHLVTPDDQIIAVDSKGIAIQIMLGERDGVAREQDLERTYDAIHDGDKQLIRLTGANHFAVNDLDNPPGTITDANAQLVDREVTIAVAADWVGVFMRAYVQRENDAIAYLHASGTRENEQYSARYEPFQLEPTPQADKPSFDDSHWASNRTR